MTIPERRVPRLPLLLILLGLAAAARADESFAQRLFALGDFEPARVEYLRELQHESDAGRRDKLRLRVADCLRFSRGSAALLDWIEREPAETPAGGRELRLRLGLAWFDERRYEAAAGEFESLAAQDEGARYQLGRARAALLETSAAVAALEDLPPSSVFRADGRRLLDRLATTPPPETRRPALAGWLGLVPGLGYAYARQPQTALAALVVIGGLAWATERGIDTDNPGLAGVCGFFAVGWQLGSVAGSVQAARRFNDWQLDRYRSIILQQQGDTE